MLQAGTCMSDRCDQHRDAPSVAESGHTPGAQQLSRAAWGLVTAAQAGDREAYGQLYQRYAGDVHRTLLARTGDRFLAEDLTGETFLRGLRGIGSVRRRGSDPGAWFGTIARNLATDHRRSHRYQRERATGDVSGESPQGSPAWAVTPRGPEQAALERETTAQLRHLVAQLPADQRECIQLRFWGELSTAQTAAVMGRGAEAIKALRHRAIRGLRAALVTVDQPVDPARGRRRGGTR